MKKILISLLLATGLIGGAALAQSQPSCGSGSHYEGSYITSQNCQQVCSLKIFSVCLNHKTECTDTSHWSGSCIADPVVIPPVVEPTEPATSTPIVIPEEPATNTPIVSPSTPIKASIGNSGSDLLAILRAMCKDDQVFYTGWEDVPNSDLQIRHLLRDEFGRSTFNGCNPTSLQQANQIRYKNSFEIGINK